MTGGRTTPRRTRAYLAGGACCPLGECPGGDDGAVVWVDRPRQADVLVVAGPVNAKLAHEVRDAYEQMPAPKTVVAVGACAIDGGAFRQSARVTGGLDGLVPVDVSVTGCPPAPEDVLAALGGPSATGTREGE